MKGIVTCEDCEIFITIYPFIASQGFFFIPKKWCEECDLLIVQVKKTVSELGLEDKVSLTIKPWLLWWWQPLLKYMAWHAPIFVVNGRLISQGVVPDKLTIISAWKNIVKKTEIARKIGV